ncbi:hypothetical protein [Methylovulum psychrotolerans]|uniref:Uncharacterized protein n=1 Tax=Methylovulum psychrotolerans TaxID=1704499 RepID=A0A2S5CGI8_9GAMM|nr:hypothetical protein [Methylovulum psychrotolerans]POZ49877.1 hypothetical protein AADEFJLK_04323 [Methylovulum psychrotolerans]
MLYLMLMTLIVCTTAIVLYWMRTRPKTDLIKLDDARYLSLSAVSEVLRNNGVLMMTLKDGRTARVKDDSGRILRELSKRKLN